MAVLNLIESCMAVCFSQYSSKTVSCRKIVIKVIWQREGVMGSLVANLLLSLLVNKC